MNYFLALLSLFLSDWSFSQNSVYKSVHSNTSGVQFSNDIVEDNFTNIMKYDYLYNGAGVGIGDFNKDGFPDIFFAGNMVDDKLYFNEGNFTFEDVTVKANINVNGWSTGVCIFDVNGDGWDDIYVCRSGPTKYDKLLANVLYVNQQDGTFKEEAEKFGLNLQGHHVQAAPLDIDLDGDLDLYLMGHPATFQHAVDFQSHIEAIRSGQIESDILLENVGDSYVDITKQAGIFEYGYGLGLAVSDINRDGYPDILVCNDFDEPDHLFVNQQNNTFHDENLTYFKHTSNYSMGNDVGDFNNDGFQDYISVDMAFEQHERSKTNMASMDPNKFFARVQLGWGYQYMHNMLQLNTGMGGFQEIAQFAGVAKTDWSWAPLFMDIDMDGYMDLFVSNGYKRDTKNNDIGYLLAAAKEKKGELSVQEFLELIPSVRIENFFFRNGGHLKFEDKRQEWGVDEKLNTNGAAYVDLDLDGDLDLILNNVDTLASVYENTLPIRKNSLVIDVSKMPQNQLMGLKFMAHSGKQTQMKEAYFVRGYCSTVEKNLYFYCPKEDSFDSLSVVFPDGSIKRNYAVGSSPRFVLESDFEGFVSVTPNVKKQQLYFEEVSDNYRLDAGYVDNKFNDFEKEILIPHMMSTDGPRIAVGDVDKNGLDDFILTSAVGEIPMVYLQNQNGTFKKILSRSFYNHHSTEDGDMALFDVNGDGNLDAMISSGGYQYAEGDTALENRLYIGNGLGMFGLVKNGIMGNDLTNSGRVVPEDIDGDGDTDFLICGRGYPGKYPYAGTTKIYRNENGFFADATAKVAPQIERIGIVNDATFSDFDGDGDRDLLIVGEWMNITYFENASGVYVHKKDKIGMPGWWSCIKAIDIDNDGDEDYLLGNAGLNNKFKASIDHPLEVYANDFDNNGTLDIVLAYKKDEHELPVRGRECSSSQMPFIIDKFPTFLSFATADLSEIYPQDKLDQALHYTATEFRSGILYNNGKQGASFVPFPDEGQLSFINDFVVIDLNNDQRLDILAVGNRFNTEVETSRYDASCGLVFIQSKDGDFNYLPPYESGFYAPHNAKCMEIIRLGKSGEIGVLVGNNNNRVQLFKYIQTTGQSKE